MKILKIDRCELCHYYIGQTGVPAFEIEKPNERYCSFLHTSLLQTLYDNMRKGIDWFAIPDICPLKNAEDHMTKVAINNDIGGFHLTPFLDVEYLKRHGITPVYVYEYIYDIYSERYSYLEHPPNNILYNGYVLHSKFVGNTTSKLDADILSLHYATFRMLNFTEEQFRCDPILIELLNEYPLEHIKIIEIPDDIIWRIGQQDDGREWIYEEHRTWS